MGSNQQHSPKTIKTMCGIEKYHELQRNKSLFGRFRLAWFVAIASLRDMLR